MYSSDLADWTTNKQCDTGHYYFAGHVCYYSQERERERERELVFLERERENYAEKGGNPFLHTLRECNYSLLFSTAMPSAPMGRPCTYPVRTCFLFFTGHNEQPQHHDQAILQPGVVVHHNGHHTHIGQEPADGPVTDRSSYTKEA